MIKNSPKAIKNIRTAKLEKVKIKYNKKFIKRKEKFQINNYYPFQEYKVTILPNQYLAKKVKKFKTVMRTCFQKAYQESKLTRILISQNILRNKSLIILQILRKVRIKIKFCH